MSDKTKYSYNTVANTVHLLRVLLAIFASKKLFKALDKVNKPNLASYFIPKVGMNFHIEANKGFGSFLKTPTDSFPNDKKSYQGKDFIALHRKSTMIILQALLTGKKSHIKDAIAELQSFLDGKPSSKKKKVAETSSPKKEKIVDTLPETVEELTLSNE